MYNWNNIFTETCDEKCILIHFGLANRPMHYKTALAFVNMIHFAYMLFVRNSVVMEKLFAF